MSGSSPSQGWQPLQASSLAEMLADDEDIEDVTLLAEHQVPGWLQRLDVPPHWQLIDFPDSAEPSLTRMAVRGPLGNGEWQAADTISVFAYTGWPAFYDVFQSADRTLRGLNAAGIAVRVLPVPPCNGQPQFAASARPQSVSGMFGSSKPTMWLVLSNRRRAG